MRSLVRFTIITLLTTEFLLGPLGVLHRADVTLAGSAEEGRYRATVVPLGFVDWTRGVVVAQGWSVAPENVAMDTIRTDLEQTREAAMTMARHNLREAISRIYIDATLTVGAYVASHDDAVKTLEVLVHQAQISREITYPDGSYEVTLEMALSPKFAGVTNYSAQPTSLTQQAP